MNFDLGNNIAVALSLKSAVTTASGNGTGVDLQGYKSAVCLATVGAEGDTLSSSVFFEFRLEHSDDNSTFTAVSSADVTNGEIQGSNGNWWKLDGTAGGNPDSTGAVNQIGYIGGKRYIRGVIHKTGTHSSGTALGITIIKGDAIHSSSNVLTPHTA